jgi:hypothetical protein
MGLLDIFGGKKKKEEEKRAYIEKLEPFKKYISNYEDLKTKLMTHDIEVLKSNVNKQVAIFTEHENIYTKYSVEIADKMTDEGYFLGMSEEQFNDLVRYKVRTGEEYAFPRPNNKIELPFSHRKEELLKSKTKVTRTNYTQNKKRNKARDYIFENDELIKIVQHG